GARDSRCRDGTTPPSAGLFAARVPAGGGGVIRSGIGYDSHRFGADRPLILGGVTIPGSPGLHGHSDADAIAHALTDALLGAAALGDIGQHFPDSDPRWKEADSLLLLARAVTILADAGWRP